MTREPRPARGMLVAVTGTRGIPAKWGGVERQCQALYTRLAAWGTNCLVYGRAGYVDPGLTSFEGVRLAVLSAPDSKYLEAFAHTLRCILHMAFKTRPALVHVYGQGPCLFLPLVRLFLPRAKVFFTCGGLDWKRRKWPLPAAWVIRLGEYFSARLTHGRIMVSQALADYYRQTYAVNSVTIPNGVDVSPPATPGPPPGLGLAAKQYVLFVGRLAPEKRVEDVIAAYLARPRRFKLAIVGDDASGGGYMEVLRQAAGGSENVVFCGYRLGEELSSLFAHAYLNVTASELEGMPLSLLEAMGYGLASLASSIAPHVEVLGEDYPWYFPVLDVAAQSALMDRVLDQPPAEIERLGQACRERADALFGWDKAAHALLDCYNRALAGPDPGA